MNTYLDYLSQISKTETEFFFQSVARMAANGHGPNGSLETNSDQFASAPLTVYILSYDATDWSDGVTLLDGNRPIDGRRGNLSDPYHSLSEAQDVGVEWALKQLQDHLERYEPALESEQERDAEFDDWTKLDSVQGEVADTRARKTGGC